MHIFPAAQTPGTRHVCRLSCVRHSESLSAGYDTRQLSNGLPPSSDASTDSDSDVDALDAPRQSLPKLLEESNQSVIDKSGLESNRCFDKPKVRFGAPVSIDSGSRKRWAKEGNESVPVKLHRLMKRTICPKKNYRENKNHCEKFNAELLACKNQDSELRQPSIGKTS